MPMLDAPLVALVDWYLIKNYKTANQRNKLSLYGREENHG